MSRAITTLFSLLLLLLLFTVTVGARSHLRGATPRQVFNKGHPIAGKNPHEYRRDAYGNTLKYGDYGKYTKTGWHVDHIKPKAHGGADKLSNYQPLQAHKNVELGASEDKRSV